MGWLWPAFVKKKKYAIQQQNHDGMGTAIKDIKDINKNDI